jgi:hypothetical protein
VTRSVEARTAGRLHAAGTVIGHGHHQVPAAAREHTIRLAPACLTAFVSPSHPMKEAAASSPWPRFGWTCTCRRGRPPRVVTQWVAAFANRGPHDASTVKGCRVIKEMGVDRDKLPAASV